LVKPALLGPLNRVWMAFGRLLHHIVSPVVMGAIFAIVVVPTALGLRLFGKDPLRLKLDRQAASYWLPRQPPGPVRGSLKQQF
jgi:fructose-specific phosphotransferase system IIC component